MLLSRSVMLVALSLSACFAIRGSEGGGETKLTSGRAPEPHKIAMPSGYRIDLVADHLTFPSALTFDEQNTPYVVEAGYSYGEVFRTPRILRIERNGRTVPVVEGDNPPWTGITYGNGKLYIAEGGITHGGRIVEVSMDGSRRVLVEGLPSFGDHHTNGPVMGPDGMLYFGQGTATNAAIVGNDNHDFGWLKRHPEFHDVPCKDVVLTGKNIETANPFSEDGKEKVVTGAFVPFGTKTDKGQTIRGQVPCSGAIMRIPASGGQPELVAWGLRNPFGLAFAPDKKLYVTDNAFDVRGSRPVFGTGDVLWRIDTAAPPAFHGWPDFSGDRALADERFTAPGQPAPGLVLQNGVKPPAPVAYFPVHASADGIDFSTNLSFGYVGEAFVAEYGDMAPSVGKVLAPVGFKVVHVDVQTGVVKDFATNRSSTNGPASKIATGGLERPVSVKFDRPGTSLWVVDFGIVRMNDKTPDPRPGTGRVWRISRDDR